MKMRVYLHKVISFASSKTGIITFLIVPSGLIFAYESLALANIFFDIPKKRKKEARSNEVAIETSNSGISESPPIKKYLTTRKLKQSLFEIPPRISLT